MEGDGDDNDGRRDREREGERKGGREGGRNGMEERAKASMKINAVRAR